MADAAYLKHWNPPLSAASVQRPGFWNAVVRHASRLTHSPALCVAGARPATQPMQSPPIVCWPSVLSMCCPEPFAQAHGLPPNPRKAAIKKRMGSSPALWRGARPLATELLDYAVGDVFQLLQLAEKLCFHLGEAGEAVVATLSQAHAGGLVGGRGKG